MLQVHSIHNRLRIVLCIAGILGVLTAHGAAAETPWIEHRLGAGETIYGVARTYGVAVQDVLQFNDIRDPTRLSPGRVVRVPGIITVTRGQTLYGLARQFGVTVTEIRTANNLQPDHLLRIGERLRIPADFSSASIADAQDTSPDEPAESPPEESPAVTADPIAETPADSETSGQQNGAAAPRWPHDGPRVPRTGRVPGVSIAAAIGDTVYAVASGTVTYVGPYATFGRVVIVQAANGYAFVYGGHGSVRVSPGDSVAPGTALGSVGSTGQAVEVYFSVWRGDSPVNPDEAPRL